MFTSKDDFEDNTDFLVEQHMSLYEIAYMSPQSIGIVWNYIRRFFQ